VGKVGKLWLLVVVVLFTAAGRGSTALALRTELAGRTLEVGGHGELREVIEENGDTPKDKLRQQLWLRVGYELADQMRFETTVNLQNGGPNTRAGGSGFYTFDDVFQSRTLSFEFEEAFLDVQLSDLDLRIGKQKFAWGKLDRFQAIDVLNTERFNDPFLLDEDERKIGVPAVQGSYYLPAWDWTPEEGGITLVWIPQYVPFRFPESGERWFPPAGVPPSVFSIPSEEEEDPGFQIPLGFTTRDTGAPSFRMENSGYAARFSGYSNGVDYAFYYYHGFDSQPAFLLTAEALADPENRTSITAETELTPVFRNIDAWGLDGAFTWGDFTVRSEAAYIRGRPFSRDIRFLISDPSLLLPELEKVMENAGQVTQVDIPRSFVVRDAVEWGVGIDYTRAGYFLLLQVNQTDVLRNDTNLLIEDIETRLLANLRKRFWHDDLEIQLVGLHAVESDYTLLLPTVTYRIMGGLEARVGYMLLAGRRSSLVGQYRNNDQVFLRLRYLF
jgi:hypothetical protein